MIDPRNVTKFDRTEIELQEFYLFCACVAGKVAYIQAQKLEQFLQPAWLQALTPFEYIDQLVEQDKLLYMLSNTKLGQYRKLSQLFKNSTKLDLETVTVNELEKVPGIGPKTSRFFMIHSRPNQRYAVLDTHILSWLRQNTKNITVPRSTPQSKSRYSKLESLFLKECDRRNLPPAALDLYIWNEKSRRYRVDSGTKVK